MEITLQQIIDDIHALQEDLEGYERKYGLLSETIYGWYEEGQEPPDDNWVLDWGDWATAYKLLLHRRMQYRKTIELLQTNQQSIGDIASRTARRESIPIAS